MPGSSKGAVASGSGVAKSESKAEPTFQSRLSLYQHYNMLPLLTVVGGKELIPLPDGNMPSDRMMRLLGTWPEIGKITLPFELCILISPILPLGIRKMLHQCSKELNKAPIGKTNILVTSRMLSKDKNFTNHPLPSRITGVVVAPSCSYKPLSKETDRKRQDRVTALLKSAFQSIGPNLESIKCTYKFKYMGIGVNFRQFYFKGQLPLSVLSNTVTCYGVLPGLVPSLTSLNLSGQAILFKNLVLPRDTPDGAIMDLRGTHVSEYFKGLTNLMSLNLTGATGIQEIVQSVPTSLRTLNISHTNAGSIVSDILQARGGDLLHLDISFTHMPLGFLQTQTKLLVRCRIVLPVLCFACTDLPFVFVSVPGYQRNFQPASP